MMKRLYILAICLFSLFAPAVAQTSKIEQQKKVIANLERSIAREEKQLAQLKKNKASAEKQVRSLTKQIEKRNALISETTRQIKQLTAEVTASELEDNAREIVRVAYRNFRYQSNLTYLFSAKSFADMARRVAMLRVATEYRIQQIKEVSAVRTDVQAERNVLAKRREELSATKRSR